MKRWRLKKKENKRTKQKIYKICFWNLRSFLFFNTTLWVIGLVNIVLTSKPIFKRVWFSMKFWAIANASRHVVVWIIVFDNRIFGSISIMSTIRVSGRLLMKLLRFEVVEAAYPIMLCRTWMEKIKQA